VIFVLILDNYAYHRLEPFSTLEKYLEKINFAVTPHYGVRNLSYYYRFLEIKLKKGGSISETKRGIC
jgi:hypothetical protein